MSIVKLWPSTPLRPPGDFHAAPERILKVYHLLRCFGGTLAGGEDVRGNIWLGLRAHMPAGVWVDLSGGYDGVGSSSYEAFTGKATVRVPY